MFTDALGLPSAAVFAKMFGAPMLTELGPFAVLALDANSPMFTNRAPPTVLAAAATATMLAYGSAPAVLTRGFLAAVSTKHRAFVAHAISAAPFLLLVLTKHLAITAIYAAVFDAIVLTNGRPSAFHALPLDFSMGLAIVGATAWLASPLHTAVVADRLSPTRPAIGFDLPVTFASLTVENARSGTMRSEGSYREAANVGTNIGFKFAHTLTVLWRPSLTALSLTNPLHHARRSLHAALLAVFP
jgi:hypothetical protein